MFFIKCEMVFMKCDTFKLSEAKQVSEYPVNTFSFKLFFVHFCTNINFITLVNYSLSFVRVLGMLRCFRDGRSGSNSVRVKADAA